MTMVERVVFNSELRAAGCMDGIMAADWLPLPRVYDIKTGSIRNKGLQFSMQLAGYAYASHVWDPTAKSYVPMPEVDKEKGLIVHIPAGEGRCDLYEVDLQPGRDAMGLAAEVLRTRRIKDAEVMAPLSLWTSEPIEATPVVEAPVVEADDLLTSRKEWITARARALVDAGHQETLKDVWRQSCADIATFAKGGPETHDEIDRVAGACALTEMVHSTGGHAPDPDPDRRARAQRTADRGKCDHGIPTFEQCPTCLRLPEGWTPMHANTTTKEK